MPCQTRARLILLLSAIVAAVGFARAQQPAIPAAVQTATLSQLSMRQRLTLFRNTLRASPQISRNQAGVRLSVTF